MNLKDYLYYQKGDKIAIILLLVLILLCGGGYIVLKEIKFREQRFTQNEKDNYSSPNQYREGDTIRKTSVIDNQRISSRNIPSPKYPYQEKLKAGHTIDLNMADTTDLKKITGIGSVFSNRIVKYRKLLGGFARKDQLREVYGIDDELYNKMIPFVVLNGKPDMININEADFEKLNKHPYISYGQAKALIKFRQKNGKFDSFENLKLINEFAHENITRLEDYLSFD